MSEATGGSEGGGGERGREARMDGDGVQTENVLCLCACVCVCDTDGKLWLDDTSLHGLNTPLLTLPSPR